jgi:hypothetical protein
LFLASFSFRYCSPHFFVYTNQETEGSRFQEFKKHGIKKDQVLFFPPGFAIKQ